MNQSYDVHLSLNPINNHLRKKEPEPSAFSGRCPRLPLLVLMFQVFDKKIQSHPCERHSSCVSAELISQ